jgi:hypothetical protein
MNSSGVPTHDDVAATGVFQGTGTIERTFLIADPVPEPSTCAMLLIGFAGMAAFDYRRAPKARRSRGSVVSQTPTPEVRARAERLECGSLGVRLERGVHEVKLSLTFFL